MAPASGGDSVPLNAVLMCLWITHLTILQWVQYGCVLLGDTQSPEIHREFKLLLFSLKWVSQPSLRIAMATWWT